MGSVVSVNRAKRHLFSKDPCARITLVAAEGVEGDAHKGILVKHRSRVARDPTQPNLRQIHLIHQELLAELRDKDFAISAGDLGENILTRDIDLLALPQGALLKIGQDVVLRVTGLRNPCRQLNNFAPGLMDAVLEHGPAGELVRKAGIMAVVEIGGDVEAGEVIAPELPEIQLPLEPV